jgi:hypothetical protein
MSRFSLLTLSHLINWVNSQRDCLLASDVRAVWGVFFYDDVSSFRFLIITIYVFPPSEYRKYSLLNFTFNVTNQRNYSNCLQHQKPWFSLSSQNRDGSSKFRRRFQEVPTTRRISSQYSTSTIDETTIIAPRGDPSTASRKKENEKKSIQSIGMASDSGPVMPSTGNDNHLAATQDLDETKLTGDVNQEKAIDDKQNHDINGKSNEINDCAGHVQSTTEPQTTVGPSTEGAEKNDNLTQENNHSADYPGRKPFSLLMSWENLNENYSRFEFHSQGAPSNPPAEASTSNTARYFRFSPGEYRPALAVSEKQATISRSEVSSLPHLPSRERAKTCPRPQIAQRSQPVWRNGAASMGDLRSPIINPTDTTAASVSELLRDYLVEKANRIEHHRLGDQWREVYAQAVIQYYNASVFAPAAGEGNYGLKSWQMSGEYHGQRPKGGDSGEGDGGLAGQNGGGKGWHNGNGKRGRGGGRGGKGGRVGRRV